MQDLVGAERPPGATADEDHAAALALEVVRALPTLIRAVHRTSLIADQAEEHAAAARRVVDALSEDAGRVLVRAEAWIRTRHGTLDADYQRLAGRALPALEAGETAELGDTAVAANAVEKVAGVLRRAWRRVRDGAVALVRRWGQRAVDWAGGPVPGIVNPASREAGRRAGQLVETGLNLGVLALLVFLLLRRT